MSDLSKYGIASFRGAAASFRTLGNAAASGQTIISISTSASGPRVHVRSVRVWHDSTAANVNPAIHAVLVRTTAVPAGGTALAKVSFHPDAPASSAAVEVLGGTASDGGVLTAITATEASRVASAFLTRLHTAVGQVIPVERELVPPLGEDEALVITREAATSRGLAVQIIDMEGTLPATNHWIASVCWEEF